jgi:hypothetical protein
LSGKVSHGGIAVLGPDAKVTIHQETGIQAAEMTAMFEAVFKKIESLPVNPDVDKEEVVETVQKIQEETKKEDQANPNKLERWISSIAKMARTSGCDGSSLAGPVSGFTAVFKKIVDKVKQESSTSG